MELTTSVAVPAWTDFLETVPGSSIYQSPGLMQVYANTDGYRPGVVAVEGSRGIRALLAFVLVSYAGRRLPKFATRSLIVGGPLGEASEFSKLLAAHESLAIHQAVQSQIRNLSPPADRAVFEASGYEWQDHMNYMIDLTEGESTLLDRMSKSRRKSIAGAERSGIQLLESGSPDVIAVYRLLQETYSRVKVPLAPRKLFETALSPLVPRGQLWWFIAVVGGSSCAVRLVLRWQNTLYDWYAGSSELGRTHHADEWLVWQVLKRGVEEGCTLFDFGGGGPPEKAYGPAEFKRRFGGQATNPGRFEKAYCPIALKAVRSAYSLARKISR